MVWENQKLSPIDVGDREQAILSDSNSSTGFRVDLLIYLESSLLVFDCALSQVPLSDNSKWISGLPYSSSVVGCRDGAIWEVDDLVAVLELPDQLALASDGPLHLLLILALVLSND